MAPPAREAPAAPGETKSAPWADAATDNQGCSCRGTMGEAEEPGSSPQLWGCQGLCFHSLGTQFTHLEGGNPLSQQTLLIPYYVQGKQ